MDIFDNCGLTCDNCPIEKMRHSDKEWRDACKRHHIYKSTHKVVQMIIIDPVTGDTILHTAIQPIT